MAHASPFSRNAHAANVRGEHQPVDDFVLDAAERLSFAPDRVRSKGRRRVVLFLLLTGAGGSFYADPSLAPRAASLAAGGVATLTALMVPSPAAPPAKLQTASLPAKSEPLPPLPAQAEPAPQPAPVAIAAAPPVAEEATVAPAAETPAEPQPLPKRPPPTDPLQIRAESVGLHPALSRALLERLTQADYQNASAAIRKALSETADDAALIWPQHKTAGLALFKVSFVQGAPQDCRRYVVEIAKDGWLTTALPMEKCGVKKAASKAG